MSENLPAIGDWDNESADLFRCAKKALTPSAADRNQVRARLALKIGAGAAALSVATTTSKAAAGTAASAGAGAGAGAGGAGAGAAVKGASIPLLAKILAPVVIAGAVGSAAVAPRVIEARKHSTTSSTTAAAAPTAEAPTSKTATRAPARTDEAAPPALSVSIDDLPAAAPAAPATPHARHAASASSSNRKTTEATAEAAAARDEEAALVAEIDAALRSGDTARASRLADEHQRRFPNGLLVQEREGARVLVRCTSTPNAALATTFLRAHPRSPMRARILAACGTSSSSNSSDER